MAITFLCASGVMVPLPRDLEKFHRTYKPGRYYSLVDAERSKESHGLYFACVAYAWENLPESKIDIYATADHWRQFCLIKAGFRHESVQSYETPEDAVKASAQAAIVADQLEKFVVTTIVGNLVTVYSARSQKMLKTDPRGMDKKDFEASKQAVLEISAAEIGVDVDTLVAEAKSRMQPVKAPPIAPSRPRELQTEAAE